MEVQVRTVLLPENRASLGEFLRGLGYELSSEPPIEKRGAGEVGVFVLWLTGVVGSAVAEELAGAVAAWIREHLPNRRAGGTVRVIYGPDDKPLAEVEIDEDS